VLTAVNQTSEREQRELRENTWIDKQIKKKTVLKTLHHCFMGVLHNHVLLNAVTFVSLPGKLKHSLWW
jgi:hypothetical protein